MGTNEHRTYYQVVHGPLYFLLVLITMLINRFCSANRHHRNTSYPNNTKFLAAGTRLLTDHPLLLSFPFSGPSNHHLIFPSIYFPVSFFFFFFWSESSYIEPISIYVIQYTWSSSDFCELLILVIKLLQEKNQHSSFFFSWNERLISASHNSSTSRLNKSGLVQI